MFKYTANEQVKKEFKKVVAEENQTMTNVAKECGLIPQQLNNRFSNDRIGLNDLKQWLNVLDYDLYIDFVKREKLE